MTLTRPEQQIVSVWFPDLAMERWIRVISQYRTVPPHDAAIILSRDGPHGPVVHSLNKTAQQRGISADSRVVDVQAIYPDLHVEAADIDGDHALVRRLVHWARRWCPWTAQDVDNGLVLDVTGCAHLFGGKAALLRDICQRFAMQGLTARVAMAPTRGAAQALARYAPAHTVCTTQDLAGRLAPLPVVALRLDMQTARLLDRLGLKTIGALAGVPRAAMMRRFANMKADQNPLILMDRALGKTADPLNAPPDHQTFMARTRLPEPVIDPVPHLKSLADDLCETLAASEQGARQLRFTIYRIDGEYRTVGFATARASRDPAHILRLFDRKLDKIDPGFGFDLLTLEATRTEPLSRVQERLDGKRDASADIAGLLDRLTARLGPDKITWSTWTQSHKPERIEGRMPALQGAPSPAPALMRERPLRILDPAEEVRVIYAVPEGPPSQFRWRRLVYKSVRHTGPERIAPEWWTDRPGTRLRDYYKVEVQDGRRFWLYREGVVHDGRGGEPRWFLHGFFA
ncbi:DNA polymerase Y family protein [Sulfitobacter sp. F26169L]|uniref:Y-family DNA polymerase n=1 Tax=Sulfitobacter sp. F26169L TaxID=2996015 RepID=UPI0022609B15|nr:DNA polymerase Y family protein [Sulfitobacter sp. F26169L]MCX7564961.1 DNA polymerase Y family protein [Sulfitobacter sp. F26169L]